MSPPEATNNNRDTSDSQDDPTTSTSDDAIIKEEIESKREAKLRQEEISRSLLEARLDRETKERERVLALKAEREAEWGAELERLLQEETTDAELCLLPEFELCNVGEQDLALEKFQQQRNKLRQLDRVVNLIPFVAPFLAYFSYENVASLANFVSELVANRNFSEVDGGAYRAQIIAPAVNGIVVPACVVTFATLLSITVSLLRQRQQEIRTTINTEAGELRILQAVVDALPKGPAQAQCFTYLIEYTSRLIAESQPNTRYDTLEATAGESEMNGFLTQVIRFDGEDIRQDLRSESYSAVARLNSERSARISSLQSSFPPLHYATLSLLAMSICSCYLLETDQDVLVFLYAVQLKFLWAILIGVFTGFGVVVYDLTDPFQGTYQISGTVKQLYTIRSALCVSANSGCGQGPTEE